MKRKVRYDYASRLRPEDFHQMTWKNGKGKTSEIAIHPPGASLEKTDFLWRLSSARIEEPGPFSNFPGYERLLTNTGAKELVLRFARDGGMSALRKGDILRFAGDEKITGEIPGGAVEDLGLIFRKDKVRAEMSALKFTAKPRSFELAAPTVFFYVVEGKLQASAYPGELKFKLEPGDVLRVNELGKEAPPEGRLVLLEPKTTTSLLIAIEIYSGAVSS